MINIAEILRDCPKGTELYSTLCGKCYFDRLNYGTIICKKQNAQEITFTSGGYYMLPVFDDCECQLFPSKDQRDWSTFQRPFKDGDVLVHTQNGRFIMSIYKSNENEKLINTHAIFWDREEGLSVGIQICCYTDNVRFATKEEKAKLFQAIKENGYKWNEETKTLEKLVEPKFKVGDKIVKKNSISAPVEITSVGDEFYYSYTPNSVGVLHIKDQDDWELVPDIKPKFKVGDRIISIISNSGYIYNVIEVKESLYVVSKNDENDNKLIDFQIQDYWELVPDKFDISTLKPFDKVLVRDTNNQMWVADLFSHALDRPLGGYTFACIGHYPNQCIPYEVNQHLLGITDDCDEFYKTWE